VLSKPTRDAVRRLLEARAEALRELKRGLAGTLGMAVCPACGVLVAEHELAEHAKSYSDARHAVVEVMLT
jgi:hypothetical protein